MKNLLLLGFLFFLSTLGVSDSRPFWIEKSSFIEGNKIFFVGIVKDTNNQSEGRIEALNSARKELNGYIHLPKAQTVPLYTQMTYEEVRPNKHYDIYRLTYVNLSDIEIEKEKIQKSEDSVALSRLEKDLSKMKNEIIESVNRRNFDNSTEDRIPASFSIQSTPVNARMDGSTCPMSPMARIGCHIGQCIDGYWQQICE